MTEHDERGPWYLLTGLVIGVIIGLLYSWIGQPVRYTDTAPASLRKDFKDQYRVLIASAYLGNEDLMRARARLELLADDDLFRALTEQAQRTLAENGSDRDARALGVLAIALGQSPPGPAQVVTQPALAPARLTPNSPIPISPTMTSPTAVTTRTAAPTTIPTANATSTANPGSPAAPTATATASPTPLPSATSASPFILLSQEKQCSEPLGAPVIRIEALDRFNNPVPGVPVIVTWPGGEERFFTGLKPEKGVGYADFSPSSGILYTVRLGVGGAPVTDLAGVMCPQPSGPPTWGAWLLKFVQP